MRNPKTLLSLILFAEALISCKIDDSLLVDNDQYLSKNQTDPIPDGGRLGNDSIIEIDNSSLKALIEQRNKEFSAKNTGSIADQNSSFYDLIDFPVNIIAKENTSGNNYLTSQGLNNEIKLATKNNSDNQKFYLSIMPLTGYIIISTYVNGQKKLVSTGAYASNPNNTVLYVKDSNSSMGSTWSFKGGDGTIHDMGYILENSDALGYDGPSPTLYNVYNKVMGSQIPNTIYFDKYRGAGKQEFEIRPVDDFQILDIQYQNDASATFSQEPEFITQWFYTNNTSIQQSTTTSFSQRASKSSTWSQTTGGSLTVSTSIKVSVPWIANSQITTTLSANHSETYGTSNTTEDTQTYNFPINIAPRTSVKATATVSRYLININYTAKMRGVNTGRIINVKGRWTGIQCSDVKVVVEETSLSGKTLRKATLQKIPETPFNF